VSQIRCAVLYSGPQNDEAALAIRACRPDGPLMMLVGRMHVSCCEVCPVVCGSCSAGCRPTSIPRWGLWRAVPRSCSQVSPGRVPDALVLFVDSRRSRCADACGRLAASSAGRCKRARPCEYRSVRFHPSLLDGAWLTARYDRFISSQKASPVSLAAPPLLPFPQLTCRRREQALG
jgi:hypothetical protein